MKIVTGKSLCGLFRPKGSFFLWGTYLPKIIFGRSQRSWRLTSSSLKPVPGRVEPQINRQTVFGGFESSFFPACLSFMAVLARLLKRAFAAPLSDKGHGVGASGRRLIRNEKKAVESSVGRESQMEKTSCYNVCQWKVKSGGKLNFSVSCHYSLLLLT